VPKRERRDGCSAHAAFSGVRVMSAGVTPRRLHRTRRFSAGPKPGRISFNAKLDGAATPGQSNLPTLHRQCTFYAESRNDTLDCGSIDTQRTKHGHQTTNQFILRSRIVRAHAMERVCSLRSGGGRKTGSRSRLLHTGHNTAGLAAL